MPKPKKPSWFRARERLNLEENNVSKLPGPQRKLISKITRDLDKGRTDSLVTYLKSGYEGLPSILRLRLVKMLEAEAEIILSVQSGPEIARIASAKALKNERGSEKFRLGLKVQQAGALNDGHYEAAIKAVMEETGYGDRKVKQGWQTYLNAVTSNFTPEQIASLGGKRNAAKAFVAEAAEQRGGLTERQYKNFIKGLTTTRPCCNHTLIAKPKLTNYKLDLQGFQTYIFEE